MIVCFHLLNDYSGSPRILSQLIRSFLEISKVMIVTTQGGILDSDSQLNSQISLKYYKYSFSSNLIKTMIQYLFVQMYTFVLSLQFLMKPNCVFFINTVLPIGPALAAYIMRKPIVYHYHEDADTKGFIYKTLFVLMQKIATKIICVSNYQCSFLSRKAGVHVVPNCLSENFYVRLKGIRNNPKHEKSVLMLSSLKAYKGISEYVRLAKELPLYSFALVINDTQDLINLFFKVNGLVKPKNLEIYSRQSDVVPFYARASLVLNLSKKEQFIETFGLTVLEAMTAGIPVITPTVGGVAELVENGVNGYTIDIKDFDCVKAKIFDVLSDDQLFASLSEGAANVADKYHPKSMTNSITEIVTSLLV